MKSIIHIDALVKVKPGAVATGLNIPPVIAPARKGFHGITKTVCIQYAPVGRTTNDHPVFINIFKAFSPGGKCCNWFPDHFKSKNDNERQDSLSDEYLFIH